LSTPYAAIVLAGGLSSRMKQFKPLLPLGDETVSDHAIATFIGCGVDVLLVIGHRREDIEAGIRKHNIRIVYNPDYLRGMFGSVQTGLHHLEPVYRAFFVLPVDIPLVRPATINRLIQAAIENPDKIIYPTFAGARGHPPLIPTSLTSAILKWDKNGGLKAVLKEYEKSALEVPTADSFILVDIDTSKDYTTLLEHFRCYQVPTDEECQAILTDIYKLSPPRNRHCKKVAEVAGVIGQGMKTAGFDVDLETVKAASVLHDIAKGRSRHDATGGKILRELGFGKVGDIVAVHSDLAGGNTALPLEAKIVYLADKLVKGEKLVSIEERYDHLDLPPEHQALSLKRQEVALNVKREFERLLGCSLESIIFDKIT